MSDQSAGTKRCPQGHDNGAASAFCAQCGAPLAEVAATEPPPFASGPQPGPFVAPGQYLPPGPPGGFGGPGQYPPPPGQFAPPPGYPSPGFQPGPFQPSQTNGLAIAAIIMDFVFLPAGIVLGHLGRRRARQLGGSGAGLALAALIIGYIFLAFVVVALIAGIAAGNSNNTNTSSSNTEVSVPPVSIPNLNPGSDSGSGSSRVTQLSVGHAASINDPDGNSPWGNVTAVSASSTRQPTDQFSEAPANGYFVTFEMAAVADSSIHEAFEVNPFDFYVLEPDGSHFDASAGNAIENTPDPMLNDTQLNSSEKVSGNVTFDVPSAHGELVYAPGFGTTPIAEWTF